MDAILDATLNAKHDVKVDVTLNTKVDAKEDVRCKCGHKNGCHTKPKIGCKKRINTRHNYRLKTGCNTRPKTRCKIDAKLES